MINFETFIFVFIFLVLLCAGWFLGYISDCIQKKQKKGLKTMTSFYNSSQEEPIFEQVLLFAGTLLPNEKIIVSPEDFNKIVQCRDDYGNNVWHWDRGYNVLGFKLEKEIINNFVRAELSETKTNKNFELRK